MGTSVQKSLLICVLLFSVLLYAGCGSKTHDRLIEPGVVQIESPGPNELMPPDGANIEDVRKSYEVDADGEDDPSNEYENKFSSSSYKTLRVRVFPLMSVPPQDPYPRTLDPNLASLYNSRGLEVLDLTTGVSLGIYKKVVLDVKNLTLYLDLNSVELRRVYIHPTNPLITTTIKWNSGTVKVEYRGDFDIRESKYSELGSDLWSIINYVDIDDYLLSVVASEMPSYFSIEALKAQAVAARTYVLYHTWIARNISKTVWDVDPTTWYQSYRGALVENTKLISPAVLATTGLVMTHSNKLIEAFFSANSGGMLCSVSECFGSADRPYIVSKPDVDGVRLKPLGTWTTAATPEGIDERLNILQNHGVLDISSLLPGYSGPQDILGLEPYEVGVAGRVSRLALNLVNGHQVILDKVASKQMRWQFGMKTAYYEVARPLKGQQSIVGYGLGHGVGMSQWGARILADQGQTFDAILKFYYEGINIDSL